MENFKSVFFLIVALSAVLTSCDNSNFDQNLDYECSYYWVSLTSSVEKDVDVFYRFMERVPPNLIKKIPYLVDYNPESHIV